MPVATANITEKMGHANGNGTTNGDNMSDSVIPTSIPEEPVTIKRRPYVPPKGSKLLNPGT